MEKSAATISKRVTSASYWFDLYGMFLMGVLVSYFALIIFAVFNLINFVYLLQWGEWAGMYAPLRWGLLCISLGVLAQFFWRLAVDLPGLVTTVYDPLPQGISGIRLEPERHPELYNIIKEVGNKIEAPMPDGVQVAHTAACFVTEERQFSIKTQRKLHLVLGMPQFAVLTTDELKVILAHELAHFGLGETRLRVFGFRFMESLQAAMRGMGGWSRFVNPVYWICALYAMVFVRLAGPVERHLELRADAISASAFGGELAIHTFLKNWQLEAQFNEVVERMAQQLEENRPVPNIYRTFGEQWRELSDAGYRHLLRRLAEEERPSLVDSHPTTQERIRVMSGYPAREATSTQAAHQLLHDLSALEDQLDAEVRRSLLGNQRPGSALIGQQ